MTTRSESGIHTRMQVAGQLRDHVRMALQIEDYSCFINTLKVEKLGVVQMPILENW